MGYIGNTPALKYASFAVQHFTTSATTSYTLDNSVANENEIALFINNVRQEPGSSYAYTASGTTLTLSAATSASDTMYCVFIGKAVQTVTPAVGSVTNDMLAGSIATSKLADGSTFATTNGITEADTWRLNTSFELGTTSFTNLTSNLERDDTAGFNYIGTGMTESSGEFTFPSTGIWLIMQNWTTYDNADFSWFEGFIRTTINSGVDYTTRVQSSTNVTGRTASSPEASATGMCLFDVTNTSTHRVRFSYQSSDAAANVYGHSTVNVTHFQFIRLGDT